VNQGTVTGANPYLGGIVGMLYSSVSGLQITNSYNTGDVISDGASGTVYAGGIVSYCVSKSGGSYNATIGNCYNAGELSGATYMGAIIGYQTTSAIETYYLYNNYYLENDSYTATNSSDEVDESAAFSSFKDVGDTLIENLGVAYAADVKDGDTYLYNSGYPILRWQNPDSTYQVRFSISYDDESNIGDDAVITVKDADDKTVTGDGTVYELANGTYTYTVEQKGYTTVEDEFTVFKEGFTEAVELTAEKYEYTVAVDENVDFTLERVGEDEDGDDTTEVIDNPEYVETSNQDNPGTYTFSLYNGTYKYTAKRLGYEKETGTVTISYGTENTKIALAALDTAKVTFKVTAEDGSLDGADLKVSVYSEDEDFSGMLMDTYDSTSEIFSDGLAFPIGEYSYKIKADGFYTVSGTFTVTTGNNVVITERMELKTGWQGAEDVDTDWYTDYPDDTEYTLSNEAELAGLAKLVNDGTTDFDGKTITLSADMDLSDNVWTPIGGYADSGAKTFSGTFDGQGHSVTLKSGEFDSNEGYFGLFGYLLNANVKNLVLYGSAVVDYESETTAYVTYYVGALAGYAESSTIENCSNQMKMDVSVTTGGAGVLDIGGLVGWCGKCTFENCNNISAVTGVFKGGNGEDVANGASLCYIGGLIGLATSSSSEVEILNCYNTGEISGKASTEVGTSTCYAGGVYGNQNGSKMTMSNCYSAADVTTEADNMNAGALVGNGSSGTFSNNYYLFDGEDNNLSEATANSTKKSADYMKSDDFISDLGDAYTKNPNGGYPILTWETGIDHIEVTTDPQKTEYDDLSDFDDTGMKITAYTSSDNSEGSVVTSGWTITDGKKLSAGQNSVTVEYKGAATTVPITVNQVVHEISSDDLTLDIAAPEAGETPQTEITLTDDQGEKYSADITWTKAGKEITGDTFEEAAYYRAHVTLTSVYEAGNVYYAFARGATPTVDGSYEIKNYEQTKNADGEITSIEFDVTYKATSSASSVDDNVSHLYYEGDENSSYGDLLDSELSITVGDNVTTYTVRELEQMVLEENVGVQGEYAGSEFAGIDLYDLLLQSGLSQNADNDTVIYLYGNSKTEKTKITVGELRQQDSSEAAIIAYGNVSRGNPIGKGKGPLRMLQPDSDAASRNNLTSIVIEDAEDAATYTATFDVSVSENDSQTSVSDPQITVEDEYGNSMSADSDSSLSYTLRDGDTYTYEVTKDGYTVESGEFTVDGKDVAIAITLMPVWDGKTTTEPTKDSDGYYLIYTADELMWWHDNYDPDDKVRLMADIALNDGKNNTNTWDVLGTSETNSSTYTLAFRGTFDGNGHVITGFYIDRENTLELQLDWSGSVLQFSDRVSQIGLFGYTSGATIKDLGLEGTIQVLDRPDSTLSDWLQVGGIVGYAMGSTQISNCYTNLGIRAVASVETGTVGSYKLAGNGDVCDMFIGGIAGSLSGSATITDCYTKGTYIGAETRQVTIGGVAGALRTANTSLTNCYSTSSMQSLPLETTEWDSYQGGIVGDPTWLDDNSGTVSNSYALNTSIKSNDIKSTANRVSGNTGSLSGNYGLTTMTISGADTVSGTGADTVNGAEITAAEAKTASTYSEWSTDNWTLQDGQYPMLSWQTGATGSDKTISYDGQDVSDDTDWDGTFGEASAPPYFNVYYQVEGHDAILAKKFTRSEMQSMAASDNVGTLYYSAGTGAGRVVKEYVYLTTLLSNAGVEFSSGDSLAYGSYYTYSYDYLMADRYYYPEWNSGSSADAVEVPTIIALKSYGDSSGVSKDMWSYYAAQADYLYAYMITYGQTSPTDYTYGYFTYQQVEGTVVYDGDSDANTTVKATLQEAIRDANINVSSTYVSDDGTDVSSAYSYVSQDVMDTFKDAVEAATAAYSAGDATNDSVMTAYEDLAAAVKTFEKAKKQGSDTDKSTLGSLIEIAETSVDSIVISGTGSDVSEEALWATQKAVDALEAAIETAKAVYEDEDATQVELDSAASELAEAIESFTASNGLLEPLARESALDALTEYTSSLDLDSYRDEEKQQIAALLKTYKAAIEDAATTIEVSELLSEAKTAIGSVETESEAIATEAKEELSSYVDLNDYDKTERAVLREILSEYSELIEAAETQEEIDALVEQAKAEIDLTIAQNEAIETLESYYDVADDYYDTQQTKLVLIITKNVKAIEKATDVDSVNSILSEAVAAIAEIQTKAEIDNTPDQITGVSAASASYSSVKISWSADSAAKYYEVYRAASSGGTYTKVKTTTETSYTDSSLKTGTKCYYKVRAYGLNGDDKLYGSYSSVVSAT